MRDWGAGRALRLLEHRGSENGGWLPPPLRDRIVEGVEGPERVYVGDELCPHRLPSQEDLRALTGWSEQVPVPVTLLTSVMTDGELQRWVPLLEMLDGRLPDVEVVANDWGALRVLRGKFPELSLSAGRLFNKAYKDPRRSSGSGAILTDGAGMFEVLDYSAFEQSKLRRLMAEQGVSRFERDLLPGETPGALDSSQFGTSIYFPSGNHPEGQHGFLPLLPGDARSPLERSGPKPGPAGLSGHFLLRG